MSFSYCSNDNCSEYSTMILNKVKYCDDCSPLDELKTIQSFSVRNLVIVSHMFFENNALCYYKVKRFANRKIIF